MPVAPGIVAATLRLSGLSLRSLAAYLQVDPGVLSRYSNNERLLPADSLYLLAGLYGQLQQTPPQPVPLTAAEQAKEARRLQACQVKTLQLQRKLQALEAAYRQVCVCRPALQSLLNALPVAEAADPARVRQRRWLEEQLHGLQKQLKTCGPFARRQLEIRLAMLETEAAEWSATLNGV
jgi:transcriptional regulator with XRE-family HTH domain